MKDFTVRGVRRMVVALVAIVTIGVVDMFAPAGCSYPAAGGIAGVTLGYYGSKFAEATKAYFEGKKG